MTPQPPNTRINAHPSVALPQGHHKIPGGRKTFGAGTTPWVIPNGELRPAGAEGLFCAAYCGPFDIMEFQTGPSLTKILLRF